MNKSILKHEIRSMKWMLVLAVLASLFLTTMFSMNLEREYVYMFSDGIEGNQSLIQIVLRDINNMAITIFSLLSIVQVFMQFRMEKSQETGRFLKSLPVRKEEFFKIKLTTGLVNITLAFIVLAIGMAIVRNNNMFWIEDIHNISYSSEIFIKADSLARLLKEIGLLYLVVLSFYTFLFMVQYSFSNVVGGIITGVLVWLAPIFITISSIYTLDRLALIDIYTSNIVSYVESFADWLLPWLYVLNRDYSAFDGRNIGSISTIQDLPVKCLISFILILVNIIVAYKFNKHSKIEDENKVIVFKGVKNIFKIGVTICSGLLVATIFNDIIMIDIPIIVDIVLIVLGATIGYFISDKITRVGSI